MGKKIIATMTIGALLSITTTALAEESGPKDTNLDTVIVSDKKVAAEPKSQEQASKTPASDQLWQPESSKAATETFTRADIEALHPQDIVELLDSALGMSITRSGTKCFVSPSTRGGANIGVIIDGSYLTWTESSRVLESLSIDMIDSVTVIRDASIITIGPVANIGTSGGAPGTTNQGFIIIKTRKAQTHETDVKTGFGSDSTQKFSFFHGDKTGDHSYFDIGYAKDRSDGASGYHNAYNHNTYLLNFGNENKNLTTHTTIFFSSVSEQTQEDPIHETNFLRTGTFDPRDTLITTFNAVKTWDEHRTTTLDVGYNFVQSDLISDPKDASINHPFENINEVESLSQINLANTFVYGKNTFKFGIQDFWWNSPTGITNVAGYPRSEKLYGYYLYDENQVNKKLTLDGGLRIDKKDITQGIGKYNLSTVNPLGSYYQLVPDPTGDWWCKNAVNFSLGATYSMDPVYKLSTRFSYIEQPGDSFAITTNGQDLPSEKSLQYELGVTANYSKTLSVSLTGYQYDMTNAPVPRNWVKDTLLSALTHETIYDLAYSANDLTRKGYELAVNDRLSPYFGLKLGYSYFTSSNAGDSCVYPHNTYTASLNYKKDSYEANVNLMYVGSFLSAATAGIQCGNYANLDANISKILDNSTKITYYAHNLANKHYVTGTIGTTNGWFYDPGIQYGIELSKKF